MSRFFELRGLGFRYSLCEVLREINLDFSRPETVAIAGPNGAGKSTLLGVMAGIRTPYRGECRYAGRDLHKWVRRAFAREVAFVPQSLKLEFPFTAEQVVLMGRTPHCDGLFEAPEDHAAVEQAMLTTDTLAFRRRDFRSLSGGERQRVVLASALAQAPKALLLDEPTTFLDLQHQLSIYRLLRSLSEQEILVITVTHDLNLAASFADRIILIDKGSIVADDTPAAVIEPNTIRRVFGVDTEIRQTHFGRPWIQYGA